MAIIGLDIGGTKILGAYFDEGVIIDKVKKPSKGEEGFYVMIQQIHDVLDELIKRNDVELEGIGVGVPGAVSKKGRVLITPNLPLEDFQLAKHLKTKYDVPVFVGNDVNLGTYGEYKEMEMTHDNVIGLFPGTGLGGGIILNGELYIGKGYAGELGHIVVQKDGVLCGCGNYGCLESYASKKGILSYMKTEIMNGATSILEDDVKKGILKSSKLKKAYDSKDFLVVNAMNQFVEYLGMGIGIIVNIFNPDVIILGGGVIEAFGNEFKEEILQHAREHAMGDMFKKTKVKLSKLEDNAVVYGAYHIAKNGL